jgi:hypothetical protein
MDLNIGIPTTQAKADSWEVLMPLLRAMYNELKELSKKKPEGVVGKAKIAIVNRLLHKCREVLADEESIAFLDVLNDDDMPQASDVVLMLSQYVAAMEQFQERHQGWDHTWNIGPARRRER